MTIILSRRRRLQGRLDSRPPRSGCRAFQSASFLPSRPCSTPCLAMRRLPSTCPSACRTFRRKAGAGRKRLVRPLLGQRQSSVFSPSLPARLFTPTPATSPRSKPGMKRIAAPACRWPKADLRSAARRLDPGLRHLRQDPRNRRAADGAARTAPPRLKSHPEVAFCRLNGDNTMTLPKKIQGAVNPAGMEERKALLRRHGYERAFLDQPPPKGAAADDFPRCEQP